ncbi:MAG: MdtA/MuxA family multidrug efflux RND transporter periplasmic adaptor subunit [Planctomycetaceae bacterium]
MVASSYAAPPDPEMKAKPSLPPAVPTVATAENPERMAAERSGRGWWVWTLLAIVCGAAWYYWPEISARLESVGLLKSAPKSAPAARVTPVTTATIEQRDLTLHLNALGTITALKTVTVRSRVEGEVTKVSFTEGQMVKEGDLLAEIDSRTYQVMKEQAEGQLARDEATLKGGKQTLMRLKHLFENKIATAQQVDDQSSLVEQAEGAIKADRAQIAAAELQLTYCRIVAPINGRIGLRLVDEGNMVRPTDPQGLAVITQLQPITLVFTVPQDEISRVQKQMKESDSVVVEAYDRGFQRKLATGKLVAIDNQVDPTNGTVRLKGEFENADGMLFPNQFVNVRLQVETLRRAVISPSVAVQRGPNGNFVYVVQADDTVEMRSVIPGPAEGTDSVITSGLSPGEIVVTAGLDRLQNGSKVSTQGASDAKQKSTSKVSDEPRKSS